ncbi:MAG: DUF2934 domain-containing protein [Gemmatimonadaceae bacterium]
MTESSKNLSGDASPTSASAQSSDVAPEVLLGDGFAAGEQIRLRAYQLYRERGGKIGDDMGDWLQAEREYFELPRTAQTSNREPQRASDRTL